MAPALESNVNPWLPDRPGATIQHQEGRLGPFQRSPGVLEHSQGTHRPGNHLTCREMGTNRRKAGFQEKVGQ